MTSTAQLAKAVEAVPSKASIMPDGVAIWIPAAVPVDDLGEPVSEQFIADMIANLNGEPVSIPIDGGSSESVAHESAPDRAIGWAHRGAWVDGQMFLEAEVMPDVAEAVAGGQLAYSSIDADFQRDESGAYVPGSARLITHALTNTPRNRRISPIQSVTADARHAVHSYTRARLAEGETMTKKASKDAPVTENVQATEGAATKAADAPMTLEDAMAKIAELQAMLAAAEAKSEEMSERAAMAPDEDTVDAAEKAAVATVEAAIKEGRIVNSDASRSRWLASARLNIEVTKQTLATLPARTQRITSSVSRAPASSTPNAEENVSREAAAILERQFGTRGATMAARIGKAG